MLMSFKKILVLFILAFFTLGTGAVGAIDLIEDDDLMNNLVKQEANRFCFSSGSASVENDLISIQNTGWSGQLGISKSGSYIYMPAQTGQLSYGYCHIFSRHMQYSNGKHGFKHTNNASQFENARYPATTMDIAMEVIDKDTSLTYHPTIIGRATKTAYSETEGQQVTVVIHKTANWNGLPPSWVYYDWLVVSAYPSGY